MVFLTILVAILVINIVSNVNFEKIGIKLC